MIFGVGGWEWIAIALIALLIFGPDQLPKLAADAARFLRDVRRIVTNARAELTQAIGTEMPDLNLRDLDPRSFLKDNVLDLLDDTTKQGPTNANGAGSNAAGANGAGGSTPASPPVQKPAAADYDDDAT
jgi:sec-independent protein translocase protein TatB